MVVLGHSIKALHVGRHLPYRSGFIENFGPIGVTVFFVISGFLITRLLLEQSNRFGSIDLRAFYWRRTFRILPAYWAYLAAIAALSFAGLVIAPPWNFARALFFTTDYFNVDAWVLQHSWSLSVEEQFYLLWPLLLVWVGVLRARRTALVLIAVAPVLRIVTFMQLPQMRPEITSMLHLRMDALMLGCWAALELEQQSASRILEWLSRPTTALCGAVCCAGIAPVLRHFSSIANPALGYSVEALSALSVVLWGIKHSESRIGRLLNSRWLTHLGVISYSVYLWQQLWLSHETPTPVWRVPLMIAGTLLSAEVSYRFVETPLLRFGHALRLARFGRKAVQRPSPTLASADDGRVLRAGRC